MSPDDLFIAQAEIDIGVARRPCPQCDCALVIRLPPPPPSPAPASAALRFDLQILGPTERTVFDTVYASYPHAADNADVQRAVDAQSAVHLSMIVMRIRKKLAGTGWQLVSAGKTSTLRLIKPPDPV